MGTLLAVSYTHLEYAVEWLAVGTHATTTVPTKKAALGFLAKACLQTYESVSYTHLDVYKRQGNGNL